METAELLVVERERHLHASGVSWGAVVAGAVVAAALSLIMVALGAGFGLSSVSPWFGAGVKTSTLDAMAIVWLLLTQLIAFGAGGYLVGRLRTRWHSIHSHEVHFRDTANGFVAWAVGVVIALSFLASAAAGLSGGGMNPGEAPDDANAYYVDRLFRSDRPATAEQDMMLRAQAVRIFANSVNDPLATDNAYLTQLVAAGTGIAPNEAQSRVFQTLSEARQAEDQARKTTARMLFWVFIALLLGAFCCSYAATIGGRQRDRVQMI